MKLRKVPWKRNLLKAPQNIRQHLQDLDSPLVKIAVTKKIPISDIQAGVYKHVGLVISEQGSVAVGEPKIPSPSMGRWSRRNIEGWEKVLYDEPMIEKTETFESPNFGNAARYGTHMHHWTREVYQREFYQAQNLRVSAELLNDPTGDTATALVKFAVESTLDCRRSDFERDLHYYLNVLQENVGCVDVHPSDATRADYIKSIALAWQFFPPGTRGMQELIEALKEEREAGPRMPRGPLADRLALFNSLKPVQLLRGVGTFGSYVGAQFADDLVVFENLRYGNALYVLYDDWQEASKRSRLDILTGTHARYDRFVHTEGWEKPFKAHMERELKDRRKRRAA